jgi:hypothetical protein
MHRKMFGNLDCEKFMKTLLLAAVITFALFAVPAHATDLTGEALAFACEGNVPGKGEKTRKGRHLDVCAKADCSNLVHSLTSVFRYQRR